MSARIKKSKKRKAPKTTKLGQALIQALDEAITSETPGKATKKKLGINLQNFLKNKLRRISYMWPPMKEAVQKARIERGKYKCASCEGIFGPKQINRDHIEPVDSPTTGFTTWDNYIERLFCPVEGIQILCTQCHEAKSYREQILRAEYKKDRKKDIENEDI